jgi:hypothetical protein
LAVTDGNELIGSDPLAQASAEAWRTYGGSYVGVTRVDGWALIVEFNRWLGTVLGIVGPLSAGTTVVSYFRNVNAVDRFTLIDDGRLRLAFEPLFPLTREGDDAQALGPALESVVFDLPQQLRP